MKRLFALLLTLLFCLLPLAACENSGQDGAETGAEQGDTEAIGTTAGSEEEKTTALSVKDNDISEEPIMLTVMSYNIEMCNHPDSTLGWNGRDPAKAMETALEVSPDILGLQEADPYWEESISLLTANGYTRIKGDENPINRPDLLFKTAVFNELGSGFRRYHDLVNEYPGVSANGADMSRDRQIRMFTWALLEEKASGKKVLAISTHLHYRKGSGEKASSQENALVRQYEVRLLLAWIKAQTVGCDCVVVMGDMNEDDSDGNGKILIDVYKNGGFSVTRDTAASKGDTGGTLDGTGRTARQQWIFDYILIKGNAKAAYYSVIDNKNDNGNTSYPSDHLPIMAKISLS